MVLTYPSRISQAPRSPVGSTQHDLRLVAWCALQIELVVTGLAAIAGWFAGPIAALIVGVGFTVLVAVGLGLILTFAAAAAWISDEWEGRGGR